MKPDHIQDALSSIAEVAIFAWSLLELLLTRILPLVGFLAGYLLLQFGSLLSSVVIPPAAAGRRNQSRAAEYSYSWNDALQAVEEELIEEEEENLQVLKEDDDYQGTFVSLKRGASSDEEPEEIIPREEASILPSLTEAEAVAPATAVYRNVELPKSASPEGRVTDLHDAADERRVRGASDSGNVHVVEPAPLDVQRFDSRPSDIGGKNLDVVGVEARHVSSEPDVVGVEPRHVSPKPESSAEKMDLEPSDVQRSETSGTLGSGELKKSSSSWRRSRRIGVLPPSLSQVKRTLMQRSRRAPPSPHSTSPANILAPSPSPIQKKQLRGSRRRTSPALRSSPSYNSFVRKFREHFLLDPV